MNPRSRFNPHYSRPSHNPDNSYNNKSTLSAHSQHLRKIVEEDTSNDFAGFSQMLRNEDRNIRSFKLEMKKEKERVNQDLSAFKTELNNTLEDLRLSLHAQLDRVYQEYMEKYAKFKGQIFEINRLKDEIEINFPTSSIKKNQSHSLSTSHIKSISQIQKNSRDAKKIHFLNYVSELQKQRILPLGDLQRELVILTQYSNGYYQPEEFRRILSSLKTHTHAEVKKIYANSHLYIREIDSILSKEEPRILDEIYERVEPVTKIYRSNPSFHEPVHVVEATRPYNPQVHFYSQSGSPIFGDIGKSEQTVKVDWIENLNLIEENKIMLDKSVSPLCGIYINGDYVFGTMDGQLMVFSGDSKHKRTLKEHNASICCLAIVRFRGQEYLASGSDHGCSKIIIWNPRGWQAIQRHSNHFAAVTAIVDLKDNCHILSGGYDKKLNVYSLESSKLVYNLPANQTSVSGAVINKSGTKVVTCGLDKSLNVWQVSRIQGQVDTLFLERKIQNNSLICSIVASQLLDELILIGCKDGKIKMVNIEKGESSKTLTCSDSNLIELVLVERKSKPNYPVVIAWPFKQNKIHILNSQTSSTTTKPWQGMLEVGCGIGPKAFISQRGAKIVCISHAQPTKHIITEFRCEELR